MQLIMSAAYIGQELESEFGRIPPSFMPLGNKRLFKHQSKLLKKNEDTCISIPSDFEVSKCDKDWLNENDIEVIKVPVQLSLGESLFFVLDNYSFKEYECLKLLYGDSLYKSIPLDKDIIGVSKDSGLYSRGVLSLQNSGLVETLESSQISNEIVVDGFFSFSSPDVLLEALKYCDFDYIKALNYYHKEVGLKSIYSDGWLDFGHVNTYYTSKADYTTQRAFNELVVNSMYITKSSSNVNKIAAEANWFKEIPYSLKLYTPQFLGANESDRNPSYKLEFLHLTALNELFVFSKLPVRIWDNIFNGCVDFIRECEKYTQENDVNAFNALLVDKTYERVFEYFSCDGIDVDFKWNYENEKISVKEIIDKVIPLLPNQSSTQCVMHGDFCFSNILYDFRSSKIKVIDPRGTLDGKNSTIYGEKIYDLAKISHSVLGLYDWIIGGYYDVLIEGNNIGFEIYCQYEVEEIQKRFVSVIEKEFNISEIELYSAQVMLFLSMLPLHSDDQKRQNALFANVFRIYKIIKGLIK